MKFLKQMLKSAVCIYVLTCLAITLFQRKLLFFPSHEVTAGLSAEYNVGEWINDGQVIGAVRKGNDTKIVWLFLHGNGGQAIDRVYALSVFNKNESVYIMEYPGYGSRMGSPSKASFNTAASEAFSSLRKSYPNSEINVIGESLGSGPGCFLASQPFPPNRIVLVLPFDRLVLVAQDKFKFLPINLIMFDRWDNVAALKNFRGRVDIFGAKDDEIIPVKHARNLASLIPGSTYHEITGGHNDWSYSGGVDLR